MTGTNSLKYTWKKNCRIDEHLRLKTLALDKTLGASSYTLTTYSLEYGDKGENDAWT